MFGVEITAFTFWWIIPIIMIVFCCLMMRGCSGCMRGCCQNREDKAERD